MQPLKSTLTAALLACLLADAAGATEELEATLLQVKTPEGFAAVWLIGEERQNQYHVDDLVTHARWRRTVQGPTLVLSAESLRSVAARFAVRRFPTCLLLAADGTELGRLHANGDPVDFHATLLRQLRAARAFLRHGRSGTDEVSTADDYWLGLFYWRRGEVFKGRQLFDRFLSADVREDADGREQRAHVLYLKGEHALDCGQAATALSLLDQARRMSVDPASSTRYFLAYARALQRVERTDQAVALLEERLAERVVPGPLEDRLLFALAYLLLERGQNSRAQAAFATLVAGFPSSSYARRAHHHLQQAGYASAAADRDRRPDSHLWNDSDPWAPPPPTPRLRARGRRSPLRR